MKTIDRTLKRLPRVIIGGVSFTAAQIEVIELIGNGDSNKMAATKMGISIKTLEKHRTDVYQALDIHDTVPLVHFALAHHIITNRYA